MTEQQWLSSTDPREMLDLLTGGEAHVWRDSAWGKFQNVATDRKLRLFCCACCRNNGYTAGKVVDMYEAEGIYEYGQELGLGRAIPDAVWAKRWVETGSNKPTTSFRAGLLRDIFGNPFRRVMCKPIGSCDETGETIYGDGIAPAWLAWNDRTVPRLAQEIYDNRAFDRMPILGDALEEAGCDNEEMLMHCRGMEKMKANTEDQARMMAAKGIDHYYRATDAPHVRGCWVVDLILGRE